MFNVPLLICNLIYPSVGGMAGCISVSQIIGLMCELGSPAVPNPLCIPRAHEIFSPEGNTNLDRITVGVQKAIEKLEWYANAMKTQKLTAGSL